MARRTPSQAPRSRHAAQRAEQGTAGVPQPRPPNADYVIRFDVPEFTCLCPLTGQPDFAHFTIEIIADKLCVELKSLKMYF